MTVMGKADAPPVELRPTRNDIQEMIQRAGSATIVIAGWVWVRPLGWSGVNGLALALLAINSVLILIRHIPAGKLTHRDELFFVGSWGIAAATLLSIRSQGVGAAFGYFAAGHAGYRLRTNEALTVAIGISVTAAIGLNIAQRNEITSWPWALGLMVGFPVFLGMANRSRDLAVTSAMAAAQAAQQAAESEARARTLVERARISRDIHDVLAHSLSGVSMQLELSEMLLDGGDSARAREAIAKAHSIVREGMAEAGRAVSAMRTDVLPLDKTLRAQFAGVAELQVTGATRDVATDVSQALIRAAQEALTNARRHAPGASVGIHLTYGADGVRLEITNGPVVPGRSPAASPGSGMGLVGMRERTALLGGSVDAAPVIDGPMAGGWRVRVDVPTEGNNQ